MGHELLWPEQVSAMSQSSFRARHTTVAFSYMQVGVQQISVAEHTAPTANLHVAPLQQGSNTVQSACSPCYSELTVISQWCYSGVTVV
jgi:hypothetical protein